MVTPAERDYAHNGYATASRLDKARKLASWCWTHGVDAARLAGLDDALRRHVARDAGVNPPSSWDTWAVVVTKLEQAAERPDMAGSFGAGGTPEWVVTTETGPVQKNSSASPNTTTGAAAADTTVSGSPDTGDAAALAEAMRRHPSGRALPVGVGELPRGWAARVASGATLGHGRVCSKPDCIAPAVAALMTEYRCGQHPPLVGEWGHRLDWTPRATGSCALGRCYCGSCPSFRLAPTPTVPTPREDRRAARR